ncbi:MAG: hypothetical protein V4610_02860 [Pseudomonadota bacterium]|jgi:hypothetical protein
MSDEQPTLTAPPRKLGWRTAAILGAVAFIAGLCAMALGLYAFPQWFGPRPVATVTLPIASTADGQRTPVVIVPGGGTAAAPAIDLDALSTRENELAARLAELEARTTSISGQARLASGYANRAEGLMIAFAARRQIDRGLPLGYIEEQLRQRFGPIQPEATGTIIQAAQQPVTIEDLRVGLDAISSELRTGAATDGWLASLRRELGNLIVLHRADTPSPLPADRLARARRTLEAGHVEAALAEVARMPGAPQAERWTTAARRYIGARQALDTIETAAIMGQGGAAPR